MLRPPSPLFSKMTTTSHLRQRKISTTSPSNMTTTTTTGRDEVSTWTKPNQDTVTEQDTRNYPADATKEKSDHNFLAFRVVPLIQRSIWMRRDVGPFLVCYMLLIVLEYQLEKESIKSKVPIDGYLVTTILFASSLFIQFSLVLAAQWSVSVQAWVGYHVCSLSTEPTEVLSNVPTHALVEPMQERYLAEIVPMTVQQLRLSQLTQLTEINDSDDNNYDNIKTSSHKNMPEKDTELVQQYISLLCRFQNRVLRAQIQPPLPQSDIDIALWRVHSREVDLDKDNVASTKSKMFQPDFRLLRYPVNLPLSFYSSNHSTSSEASASFWPGPHLDWQSILTASQLYGPNTTQLQLPSYVHLLQEQVIAPFFLFQLFCVLLWLCDEYWYYALYTLLALFVFEATVAYNRLQSLQRLYRAGHHGQDRVWVRRPTAVANSKNTRPTWMCLTSRELVPGDIISLSATNGVFSAYNVPADILLLKGNAVCDEALLTGESIPQLKHALDANKNDEDNNLSLRLDMEDNQYKESILFAGTVLLTATPEEEVTTPTTVSRTTASSLDHGVFGMVLRTGFETLQGNLLRTMAHSSQTSGGVNSYDTFVFISLLLVCALVAASWVLHEGWQDERRNRFRLVLHVIIIITSVVPPELPMELSLAVTNSVADLMKRCNVYCTEHYRIPLAGQVNLCCFDKTGTLTSDEMRLKGVRLPCKKSNIGEDEALIMPADSNVPWPTLRIMAACHALAIAAAPAIQKSRRKKNTTASLVGDPLEQTVLRHTGYRLVSSNLVVLESPNNMGAQACNAISILHRFAFSSKLKRMTVLVTEESGQGVLWALTKGAPETLKSLLRKESVPNDYDSVANHHMSRGRRVLAMAYRDMGNVKDLQTLKANGRIDVERNLTFAGYLILDCPLKSDTKTVISDLKKSGHNVVMITGDAVLTAAEVARQVGIIRKSTPARTRIIYKLEEKIKVKEKPTNDVLGLFECCPLAFKEADTEPMSLSFAQIKNLTKLVDEGDVSFCLSGDVLVKIANAAVRSNLVNVAALDEKHILLHPFAQTVLAEIVPLVSVFARHAPHQKEAVVAAFNRRGYCTLMCGDGTNDVGALKRAHVGISIISAPGVELKQREASAALRRSRNEVKRKNATSNDSTETALRYYMQQLQEAQDELDFVELGDASVAAPFTSRAVSIKCCKDVIQQGRCTLVTMLSIYKVLGINCLMNAMVLSRLFLHGVKQGDRQMTAMGIAVAALFYFVTRAQPLPDLSDDRPPSSVLCWHALLSILMQFSIHCGATLLVTEVALSFVDPFDPSLVPDGPFNPNVLNSATFIMTCAATLNTFAVNYRGRPFMADINENKFLYRSLQACYAILFICSLEIFPPLNELLQLTAMPSTSNSDFDQINSMVSNNMLLREVIKKIGLPLFLCGIIVIDTMLVFASERAILLFYEKRHRVQVVKRGDFSLIKPSHLTQSKTN